MNVMREMPAYVKHRAVPGQCVEKREQNGLRCVPGGRVCGLKRCHRRPVTRMLVARWVRAGLLRSGALSFSESTE